MLHAYFVGHAHMLWVLYFVGHAYMLWVLLGTLFLPPFLWRKNTAFWCVFYKICGFMTIFLNCYDHRLFLYMYIMGTLGI